MGGAIFERHRGSLSLLNVTASGNSARGGAGFNGALNGSGLGAVIFNLNGDVTIDYSTFAASSTQNANGLSASNGIEDGTVYSIAYRNRIEDGIGSSATLTIHASIIRGAQHDAGAGNAVVANRIDGDSANTSTITYVANNFIASVSAVGGATTAGTGTAVPTDPQLAPLTRYNTLEASLPVFPTRTGSPARKAVASCKDATAINKVVNDERDVTRSYPVCDAGAYEYDNDEIFPDDSEGPL